VKKIFSALFIIIFIHSDPVFAQCSDAGACRFTGFEGNNSSDMNLSFSYKNGYSGKESDVIFSSFQAAVQYRLFRNSVLEAVIPYNLQSGPLGKVGGAGDLILSWSQELFSNEKSSISLLLGVKLATGDENKEPELPQVYQPGLGSDDLIFTVDYNYENFGFGAGYQLAGKRNDKEGLKLKRGDDLLFRTSYIFRIDNITFLPQLILVKRLSESNILNLSASEEKYIDIDKSDQLQLNLLLGSEYLLNNEISLFTEAALPLLKREVNVDGLTRAYTLTAGLKLSI